MNSVWDELEEWNPELMGGLVGKAIARGRALEAIAEAARRAYDEILTQKENWPGEVDTLGDALEKLGDA